jgi:hypothetical protein
MMAAHALSTLMIVATLNLNHAHAQTPVEPKPGRIWLPVTLHDDPRPPAPTPTATLRPQPTVTPQPSRTSTATAQPSPSAPAPTASATPTVQPGLALRTIAFTASSAAIINPERGFFWPVDLFSSDSYADARTTYSVTLVRSYARLDAYRTQDLPQALLDTFDARMNAVRAAGVKLVLRFSYNFGPYPNSEPDASVTQIKRHLQQLTPYLHKHADVIAWMEAGFVGAWGEWHTSTNGIDTDINAKREVAAALLAALPLTRSIQLRYPGDIRALYGATFAASDAHNGSDKSRIGHHNDCFLASADDQGTYGRDNNSIVQDKTMLATYGAYTPVGGETCGSNPPRSNCPTALAELAQMGWSSINLDYETTVLNAWRSGGCFDEIDRRLGYRLALESATLPFTLTRGTAAPLTLRMANSGFARPINARQAYVLLEGPARRAIPIAIDPRALAAGTTQTLQTQFSVPADLPPGAYSLALWLPDSAPALQSDARYAIQFANTGVWQATSGANRLVAAIQVE